MKGMKLNESELKDRIFQIYKEEQYKILEEKWNKLSKEDKIFVFEFAKKIYPEQTKLIKESKWYNTLGDVVGIFDPTGIVDIVNGISYWRQGDKLYAILSFVSAIPYLGDLIAKPVIGVMKLGGGAAKAFKAATLTGDAVKIAGTAKRAGGPIAKMVETAPTWGEKLVTALKGSIGRVPLLGSGLVKVIEEYVQIFGKAGKEMKAGTEIGKGIVKSEKALSAVEKEELLKQMSKDQSFRGFRDLGTGKNSWLSFMKSDASLGAKFYAGVPRIFGGNPATRSLMKRTKFYAGFLDWLGVGNFVGPDELEKMYPDVEKQYEQYAQLPESQNLWNQEFASGQTTQTTVASELPSLSTAKQSASTAVKTDAFTSLIGSLLGGGKALV
jgi:hypothetical protein